MSSKGFFCENATCLQKRAAIILTNTRDHFYQDQSIRITSGDTTAEAKSSEQGKGTAASFNACSMDTVKTLQDPATEFWQRTLLLNTSVIVCTLSQTDSHAVLSYLGEKSLLLLSDWWIF